MNLEECMLRECKICKNQINCFKENDHEYSKHKHRKTKNSRIQTNQ